MKWSNLTMNSIHQRAWSYIMITCAVVLSISITLNFINALYSFRAIEKTFHHSIALTVEQNISASLTFNHQESAQELVNGLVSNQYLAYVLILDKNKEIFAQSVDSAQELAEITRLVEQGQLEMIEQVDSHQTLVTTLRDLDQNILGYLLLASNQRLFQELLSDELVMLFWQSLFALAIASFLSRRFAHTLTRPILETSQFIHKIIKHKDYSLQLSTSSQDEMGQLQQELNELVQLAQNWTQDLQDYGQNLASEVSIRTKSLHEAKLSLELTVSQLKQAKDAADAANVAKTQFLANMSHEIRTPMQGILGMSELLSNSMLSYEQNQHLKIISKSAQDLLQIINDVLDFSKIEHGHLTLNPAAVVLRTELEASIRLFYAKAQQKGIELLCVMPIQSEEVFMVDKLRLNQVMVNLLGNAVKFTNRGKVILKWQVYSQGRYAQLELSVIDTGIGVKQEKQHRIFESFQQEDSTTTRMFGGTGLGLAISRQIVAKMDGQLNVSSVPGQGAQFTVSLTLPVVADTPQFVAPNQFSGLAIAICIPSILQSAAWRQHCEHWGVSCHVFCSASEFTQQFFADNQLQSIRAIIIDESFSSQDVQLVCAVRDQAQKPESINLIMLGKPKQTMPQHEWFTLSKPVSTNSMYVTFSELFHHQPLSPKESSQQTSFELLNQPEIKLLVAEDNLTNQDFASAVLTTLGCKFDMVENGLKAIEMFKKEQYDLILMDCQMPEMDGYSATLAIRHNEKRTGQLATPVIALTAHALGDEKQKCLRHEMDDYLSKPYNIASLVNMMNKHLPEQKRFKFRQGFNKAAEQLASQSQVDENPLIDVIRLDNIRALQRPDQENILAKIITRYVEDSHKMVAQLSQQRALDNLVELKLTAHKLKSSARNLGGTQLGASCERLEMVPVNDLDQIDALLAQIGQHHISFSQALLQLKEKELEGQCEMK